MSVIRLSEQTYKRVRDHLSRAPGEHFGFLLAKPAVGTGGPIFLVERFHAIPDTEVTFTDSGWEVGTAALLEAINAGVLQDYALIEVHNHPGGWSTFSSIDRSGFNEFVPYVLDSLPGRPYGATVWTDDGVYGEYFLQDGTTGSVRSITVYGNRLRQLTAGPGSRDIDPRFRRQEPWFTQVGQRRLGRLRVAIVGLGGTGSHVVQNLAYLGVRDFVLIDDDVADETNLNRLVTATAADVGTPKVILARRLIRSVAPGAEVQVVEDDAQTEEALAALKGVDLIFGCIDNDGARLLLNQLALAYRIPLIDLGVGIAANKGGVDQAGGRVAIVIPGGPCLHCMGEIDVEEARYFLKDPRERELDHTLGYVEGIKEDAPSVVSLNAATAACAVNEFAILVSGIRPPHPFTELDLIGQAHACPSQRMSPRTVGPKDGCVQCAILGHGDEAGIDRYARCAQKGRRQE